MGIATGSKLNIEKRMIDVQSNTNILKAKCKKCHSFNFLKYYFSENVMLWYKELNKKCYISK